MLGSTPPETAATEGEPEPPSIEAFDCFVVEGPGKMGCEPASPGADDLLAPPGSQGFRRWAAGGPNGAVWNPFHVSCRVRVRAHCATAAVTLRISSRVVKALQLPHVASPQLCQFDVSSDDLENNEDQAPPNEFEPPFPTAIFRVEVGQSCGEPPIFGVARDAFVGGFAFGE